MKAKKLSRRERALIQHAVKRALLDYEANTMVSLYIGGKLFRHQSLAGIICLSTLITGTASKGEIPIHFGEGTRLVVERWR